MLKCRLVVGSGCRTVSCMKAEVLVLAVVRDAGLPLLQSSTAGHTDVPCPVISSQAAIADLLPSCSWPQILASVIQAIPIAMVNFRPTNDACSLSNNGVHKDGSTMACLFNRAACIAFSILPFPLHQVLVILIVHQGFPALRQRDVFHCSNGPTSRPPSILYRCGPSFSAGVRSLTFIRQVIPCFGLQPWNH